MKPARLILVLTVGKKRITTKVEFTPFTSHLINHHFTMFKNSLQRYAENIANEILRVLLA